MGIKDPRLLGKDLYLEADRAGRGTSLRGGQREEMWNLFHAYQHALREGGLQAGNLLVLHANSSLENALRASVERRLGEELVHDAKAGPTPAEAFCSVTTLTAATGLEAPFVILLGMDWLLESEEDTRLSEGERRDLRRDHTRMLYMGFTRAGQRLVVLRSGANPPAIRRLDLWEQI